MPPRREPFNALDRRIATARMMLDSKVQEFAAQVMAGDQAAMERARFEATAQLEACLDLTEQSMRALLKRGF